MTEIIKKQQSQHMLDEKKIYETVTETAKQARPPDIITMIVQLWLICN